MTQDLFRGWKSIPESLHRYMYVYNNPLKYIDPDGYQVCASSVSSVVNNPITVVVTFVVTYVATNMLTTTNQIIDWLTKADDSTRNSPTDEGVDEEKPNIPDEPVGKVRKLSNEEIKQMGGEQETSKLKKEGGKSKSDLYRDKDGHIWNRLKEKGKGEWEYVGEAEWWGLE